MNIYEVKFSTIVYLDADNNVVTDMEESELDIAIKEGEVHAQMFGDKFHIGAINLGKAFLEAIDFLDENIGKQQYDISSIKEKEKIMIVNWPNDGDDCDCLECRTERAAEEDKIRFTHDCNQEIVVVDGWDTITCHNCGKEILRDRIIGGNGHYIFMNIDAPKKETKEKGGKKNKKNDDANVV